MTMEFSDRKFIYEYDHAPRGYGMWGFKFEGHEFWHTGKYAEAKAACRKAVKEAAPKGYKGHVIVEVLT